MKGSLVNRVDVDDKNESHEAGRSITTVSNIVNHVDLADTVTTPPPILSCQEPVRVTAPRVTCNRARPRMIVDVDEFMDVESKEDFSNRTNEDSIPSALPYPQRSASQNAAVAAVIGRDDDDDDDKRYDLEECDEKRKGESVTDCTADLSEDEIAAIIPPNLQRHIGGRNVTPGAFPVPGRGSVSLNRRGPASARRSQTEELDECGDGLHMISATLVDADAPMLVYAERLWWKRRLVWCVSAWMLLAVTVLSVSITLAIRLTSGNTASENPPETVSSASDGSSNTSIVPNLAVPSKSPSASPIDASPSPTEMIDPPGTMIAMHAASWGVLTSCSDYNDEFESYEMVFNCIGGRIKLERSENVECQESAVDPRKLSCRLKSSGTYTDVYQQATGLALFSCRDTISGGLMGIGQLFNVSVPNCSSSFSTYDTASTFVSMARFCKEGNDVQFRDVLVNECKLGGTCLVVLPSEPDCLVENNDGQFRTLNWFDDFKNEIGNIADEAISFCYESTTACDNQTVNSGECILSVPGVTSENVAIACDPGNSEANIDDMWMTSKAELDPSKRMDVIVQDILS